MIGLEPMPLDEFGYPSNGLVLFVRELGRFVDPRGELGHPAVVVAMPMSGNQMVDLLEAGVVCSGNNPAGVTPGIGETRPRRSAVP